MYFVFFRKGNTQKNTAACYRIQLLYTTVQFSIYFILYTHFLQVTAEESDYFYLENYDQNSKFVNSLPL